MSTVSDFLALLPAHKCGLYLAHNQHRDYYLSAMDYIKEEGSKGKWRDEEAKQRSIDINEIWELQWYPRTPVGFNRVFAPTLEELLELASTIGL